MVKNEMVSHFDYIISNNELADPRIDAQNYKTRFNIENEFHGQGSVVEGLSTKNRKF